MLASFPLRTTPFRIHQEGESRDLANSERGVSAEAYRTAWPNQAVGLAGEGRGGHGAEERRGGGDGGGTRAGRSRGARSPSRPLEGLQKSEGCFVTPKKVRRVMGNLLSRAVCRALGTRGILTRGCVGVSTPMKFVACAFEQ